MSFMACPSTSISPRGKLTVFLFCFFKNLEIIPERVVRMSNQGRLNRVKQEERSQFKIEHKCNREIPIGLTVVFNRDLINYG